MGDDEPESSHVQHLFKLPPDGWDFHFPRKWRAVATFVGFVMFLVANGAPDIAAHAKDLVTGLGIPFPHWAELPKGTVWPPLPRAIFIGLSVGIFAWGVWPERRTRPHSGWGHFLRALGVGIVAFVIAWFILASAKPGKAAPAQPASGAPSGTAAQNPQPASPPTPSLKPASTPTPSSTPSNPPPEPAPKAPPPAPSPPQLLLSCAWAQMYLVGQQRIPAMVLNSDWPIIGLGPDNRKPPPNQGYDFPWRCELINYTDQPIYNLGINFRVKFLELVRGKNNSYGWGAIKRERDFPILLGLLEPGREKSFTFVMVNAATEFDKVDVPVFATGTLLREDKPRALKLTSPAGSELLVNPFNLPAAEPSPP